MASKILIIYLFTFTGMISSINSKTLNYQQTLNNAPRILKSREPGFITPKDHQPHHLHQVKHQCLQNLNVSNTNSPTLFTAMLQINPAQLPSKFNQTCCTLIQTNINKYATITPTF
jgi:hypothetical protein